MAEFTGEVVEINDSEWHGVTLWSCNLNNSDRTFRLGKVKPEFEVGDNVKIIEKNNRVIGYDRSEDKQKQRADKDSGGGTTDSISPTGESTDARKRVSRQLDTGEKQVLSSRTNSYSRARADAVRVIVAALQMDALPWAKNTAKGKKLDLLRGQIETLTQQFIEAEEQWKK